MSVSVDYDGSGSPNVIYSVVGSPAWTADTTTEVLRRGNEVYQYLTDLETSADAVASTAYDTVAELRAFSASVGSVSFTPPEATFSKTGAVSTSVLPYQSLSPASFDPNASYQYNLADPVERDNIPAPALPIFNAPPVPSLSPNNSAPSAPASYEFESAEAPELVLPNNPIETVAAPTLQDISPPVIGAVDLADLELLVDVSGLDAAIARLQTPAGPVLPIYTKVFAGLESAAASLIDAGVDAPAGAALTGLTVHNLLADRGLDSQSYNTHGVDDYRDAYASSLDGAATRATEYTSGVALKRAMFPAYAAAVKVSADIATALFDLDFAAAKTAAEAKLNTAVALISSYNAEVLRLQAESYQYVAETSQAVADADAFELEARQVELVGQVNALEADSFAIQERAKKSQASVYAAQVSAEETKLDAYAAIVQSYEAKVLEARTAVLAYAAEAQAFDTAVRRAVSEYELYAAKVRGTQEQNSAKTVEMAAQESEFRALSADASAITSAAAASATRLSVIAAERSAAYQQRAVNNATEALRINAIGSDYNKEVTDYVNTIAVEGVGLAALGAKGTAISEYVDRAQRAAGRAATLSQTANEQLARAYASVYDAAGRAGSAIASGQLSSFRASASLTASEALQAADSYGVSVSSAGANNYSESDSASRSIDA